MTSQELFPEEAMTRNTGKRARSSFNTMLMTMQGTPYIYQGEEIGMTNVSFDSIEDP